MAGWGYDVVGALEATPGTEALLAIAERVDRVDAAVLTDLGRRFATLADGMDASMRTVEGGGADVARAWQGPGADAFARYAADFCRAGAGTGDAARAAQRELTDLGRTVQTLRDEVAAHVSDALDAAHSRAGAAGRPDADEVRAAVAEPTARAQAALERAEAGVAASARRLRAVTSAMTGWSRLRSPDAGVSSASGAASRWADRQRETIGADEPVRTARITDPDGDGGSGSGSGAGDGGGSGVNAGGSGGNDGGSGANDGGAGSDGGGSAAEGTGSTTASDASAETGSRDDDGPREAGSADDDGSREAGPADDGGGAEKTDRGTRDDSGSQEGSGSREGSGSQEGSGSSEDEGGGSAAADGGGSQDRDGSRDDGSQDDEGAQDDDGSGSGESADSGTDATDRADSGADATDRADGSGADGAGDDESGSRDGAGSGSGSDDAAGDQAGTGGTSSSAPGGGPGGDVGDWIRQATAILAENGVAVDKMNPDDIATIIDHESGGDPDATNGWDSNADKGTPSQGLMQTIGPTFEDNKLPGHDDIRDPIDNIIAGVRYAIERYGSVSNVPGVEAVARGDSYVGY